MHTALSVQTQIFLCTLYTLSVLRKSTFGFRSCCKETNGPGRGGGGEREINRFFCSVFSPCTPISANSETLGMQSQRWRQQVGEVWWSVCDPRIRALCWCLHFPLTDDVHNYLRRLQKGGKVVNLWGYSELRTKTARAAPQPVRTVHWAGCSGRDRTGGKSVCECLARPLLLPGRS